MSFMWISTEVNINVCRCFIFFFSCSWSSLFLFVYRARRRLVFESHCPWCLLSYICGVERHDSRARLSIALTMSVIWHFRFFELIARERKRNERKKFIISVCMQRERERAEEMGMVVCRVRRPEHTHCAHEIYSLDSVVFFFLCAGERERFCCSLLFAEVIGQSNVCIKCVVHSIWEA